MKIIFVTNYTQLYGANRSLIDLILPLRDKGVEPIIVLPNEGDLTNFLRSEKIEILIEPFVHWMNVFDGSGNIFKRIKKKNEFSKKGEIIHEKNLQFAENLFLKLEHRNVNLIYSNTSIINVGFELAKKLKVPHIWHVREFGDKDYNVFPYCGRSKFLKTVRKSDRVIFISNALKNYFQMENYRSSSVVYNGVLSKRKSINLEIDYPVRIETVFSLVGLIMDNKGQHNAVHAFAKLNQEYPETRLLIAGEGDVARIKKLIEQYGLNGKVELLGYINNPFPIFIKSHAVLMCSKHEAMGRVTAEAFHCARPVIGFNSGATPELIDHMKNGILYNSEINGLYEAMKWVVLNRNAAKELGLKAKEKALQLYTTENYSEQIYSIIERVLFDRKNKKVH